MLLPFCIFWTDDHRHASLSLKNRNDVIVNTRVLPENNHRLFKVWTDYVAANLYLLD
jgi:hypothetical protein